MAGAQKAESDFFRTHPVFKVVFCLRVNRRVHWKEIRRRVFFRATKVAYIS